MNTDPKDSRRQTSLSSNDKLRTKLMGKSYRSKRNQTKPARRIRDMEPSRPKTAFPAPDAATVKVKNSLSLKHHGGADAYPDSDDEISRTTSFAPSAKSQKSSGVREGESSHVHAIWPIQGASFPTTLSLLSSSPETIQPPPSNQTSSRRTDEQRNALLQHQPQSQLSTSKPSTAIPTLDAPKASLESHSPSPKMTRKQSRSQHSYLDEAIALKREKSAKKKEKKRARREREKQQERQE